MKLGVLVSLNKNVAAELKRVHDFGFSSCQLCGWQQELMNDENAKIINDCTKEYGIEISAFWCGWSGPQVWDFFEGPHTLGLVPEAFRYQRSRELMAGSDFAKKINVKNIATHVGFLPENPATTEYHALICCLKEVAEYVKNNGQNFLFETGQETPVTLRRTIEDIGTGNLGINLDPANLILYGKANPIDALDVFGEFVMDVHGKDGLYPTDGKNLGLETPMGEGKVDFPKFIAKLKEIGYDGPITIEREIVGDQQNEDIVMAKALLEKLI